MNKEEQKLRAIQTVKEMFEQRGYFDVEETDTAIIAYRQERQESHDSQERTKVCAFTDVIYKLNIAEMKNYSSLMDREGISYAIIIYGEKPTPAVKDFISNLPHVGKTVDLYHIEDLQFNITKHRLVPQHILLDEKECKEFKKKYGSNIQVLLKSDPIAKFYDFPRGSIIKVIRKGGYIAYRIVR